MRQSFVTQYYIFFLCYGESRDLNLICYSPESKWNWITNVIIWEYLLAEYWKVICSTKFGGVRGQGHICFQRAKFSQIAKFWSHSAFFYPSLNSISSCKTFYPDEAGNLPVGSEASCRTLPVEGGGWEMCFGTVTKLRARRRILALLQLPLLQPTAVITAFTLPRTCLVFNKHSVRVFLCSPTLEYKERKSSSE